ncbi:MAG: hypothetical protein LBU83_05720, partial [Bacteroidales bacterium]|nr:hypothetical protein [Bacteroidales bacterium]
MKKIRILMFLLLIIIIANAQKSIESSMFEKLNLKLVEFIFDEQKGKIDKETKVLRVNRNEYFKVEAEDTEAIALNYLHTKRELYGLSNNLKDIKITGIVESPAGKYVYFSQSVNDISVFATNFIVFINKKGIITYTLNEFRNVAKYGEVNSIPSISKNTAFIVAKEYLNIKSDIFGEPKTELVYFESIDSGLELAWKININSMNPVGSWQIFINAENERIIHVEDIRRNANGSGTVFIPNPLVSANVSYGHNNCFVHNNGATNSCLDGQLIQVTLKDLTCENGLYKLKGPYCIVEDIEPPYGHNIPELPSLNFHYARNQEEFAAVMCYYHIDLAARRILELGYIIPNGLKHLRTDPHGYWGIRDAYVNSIDNYIAFGSPFGSTTKNFVPTAEDSDYIWHEYAHIIQDNFTPTGMAYESETATLQEGSSDYWATSYKRSINPNYWEALWVWFHMDDPLFPRRTDLDWIYPDNYVFGHIGGQIWSSALMKIWGDIGRDITDKLFLESHLIWGYSPYLRDGAAAFIQADINLYNGAHLCHIIDRFREHGLLYHQPPQGEGLITQNTIWKSYVRAKGTTIIPCGVTLTINGIVHFDNSASIIILPGGKLIIEDSYLMNTTTNEMWKGISVMGDLNQPIQQQYQGYLQINESSIINAEYGITVQGGGIVSTTDAHFLNNKLCIKFESLAVGQTGTSGTFVNTEFVLNSNFFGNNFDAFLKMDGCGKVNVTGCTFSSNVPLDTNKGIVASNASTSWDGNNQLLSVPIDLRTKASLTNFGTISSNDNTIITIQPGGKLIIDGGTLTNACGGNMWQGITVQGDGINNLETNYQGYVQVKNGGTIENAVCGIYSTNGGMINAENASFVNNTVAVKIDPVALSLRGYSATFTKTNFTINDDYPGNTLDFETHIKLSNSNPV